MTSGPLDVVEALELPARARETHRLTKKDIVEQWEHSVPDARLLGRAISTARIVGVLSPATTGVPDVRDPDRPVDMIPVIEVRAVDGITAKDERRVAELLHRVMPRPAIIAMCPPEGAPLLSLALTRLSKTEAGMSVVEEHLLLPITGIAAASLHVNDLDRADLGALYRDLVRRAAADGRPAASLSDAKEAIRLRHRITGLDEDLQSAIRSAGRAESMQRRIDFNTEVRSLRDRLAQTRATLFDRAAHRVGAGDGPKVGP